MRTRNLALLNPVFTISLSIISGKAGDKNHVQCTYYFTAGLGQYGSDEAFYVIMGLTVCNLTLQLEENIIGQSNRTLSTSSGSCE